MAGQLTDEEIETLRELAHAYRSEQAAEKQTQRMLVGAAKVLTGAQCEVDPRHTPMMKPRIGEIVIYRARTRDYELPAIVTANVETLDRRGVIRGDVPDITGEEHVHLNVQTCGEQLAYQEFDVPFAREPIPGTWAWR